MITGFKTNPDFLKSISFRWRRKFLQRRLYCIVLKFSLQTQTFYVPIINKCHMQDHKKSWSYIVYLDRNRSRRYHITGRLIPFTAESNLHHNHLHLIIKICLLIWSQNQNKVQSQDISQLVWNQIETPCLTCLTFQDHPHGKLPNEESISLVDCNQL